MRIVQVCPYAWNARGGVQSHVANLARELRLRGHDVLVIAPWDPRRPDAPSEPGVQLIGTCTRIPFNGSVASICLQPSAWLAARNAVSQFAPDLVHVHEPLNMSLSTPVTWSSRVPVVATFHMYCPRSVDAVLYSVLAAAVRPLSRRITLKLAVSQAAASCAASRVGGPVEVVPNGVDVDRFHGVTPMAFPAGPKMLFVNRLEKRKGFDIALRAFELLADRVPGARFIAAGDGPYRQALSDIPSRIRDRVIVLGDVPTRDLPSVYAASDVFVAPARGKESFGIVLLEAMAAGVPIVATNIAGYREVVRHKREALLVAPDSAEAVAGAVGLLFESPALSKDLAAAGRTRVAQFQWDIIAAQLESYYAVATERDDVQVTVPRSGVRRSPALRSDD